ncbi:MAG TPA: sugar phosphate isomerase/epimerase [Chloroflexi bacterium]|nr:sugar phosphate isomerase/epimerase [Chloroflexota bacterium]
MIKFGVSPWVWAELIGIDDVGLIDKAHGLGFEGIEVAVLNPDSFDVPAVAAALRRTGLTPIVSTALPEERDLIHPNPEYRRNGQAFLRYCVDMAVRLGADRVIGPICSAPGRLWLPDADQRQHDFDRAVESLRPVAEYAADHGIRLALEVLNRYESSFVNTAEEGLQLVAAVDRPAFGLLLDTFHMHIEEKAMGAAIQRTGKHLYHFHAIEGDRGTPGSGSVDWAGVVDALHRIDYQGWIVIEGFSTQVEWLARAVHIWRPLAPDLTELASEGRAFLQSLMRARGAI